MTAAVTMEELLAWSEESSQFWKAHLDANPALLELPCGIGKAVNVQDFVRHIWSAELRMGHRIAGLPLLTAKDVPPGPLDALYDLHLQAVQLFRALLDNPTQDWDATITFEYDWLPPHVRTISKRKGLAHALFHGQRHWAQLATLVRSAGFPSQFNGDLLFSPAMK
ncbi:MAG: hypothetical protein ABSD67_02775 [Terracidiphilus sp.]|jgi:uncharacterized damage-inducible protein DinB